MTKYYILLIIDICLFLAAPTVMDKGFMAICAVMATVKVIMSFYEGNSKCYNLRKIYFRHSVIFVLCFYIVFFQSDIDYIVGLAEENDYFVYNPKVVCKAMALSSMALTCFLLGYCFSKTKELSSSDYAKRVSINYEFPRQRLNYLALLTAFFILVYIIFVPKEYLSNGYGNAVDAGPVVAITGYLIAFFIALFVSYSMRYHNRSVKWIKMFKLPLILLSVYALLIIVTGRRTEVVRLAFVAMCSYVFISGRNANIKRILFLSAIGMLVLSVLGIYRSLQEGSVVDGYNQMKNILSVMPPTKELSTSVNTLHVAMTYYPDKQYYDMGASFLPSFLKIIPGLTGILQLFLGLQMKGSDLIISELFFEGGQIEWGLGSSIIADIYISFGVLGVLFVFYILGRFLRWLEVGTFCKSSSPYFLALSFSCYSQFMFACRGGVGVFFLCWTYACIIIYLVVRPVKVINRTISDNK